ncbi:alpha/beta hydrolase [Nonomuraea sp. NPDC050328]|uniref:alpha/beta hydrolase n=1 Tax=Nonomuraea sp. NPDC050328 TaxID=3364361 RepID=UPI003789D478
MPAFDSSTVTFDLPDRGRLAGVRLYQEVGLRTLDFEPVAGGWRLVTARPPVSRMEYLFELLHRDGNRETVLDPGNARRVAGVFGDKSVLEFEDYAPPGWLAEPPREGHRSGTAGRPEVSWWSPEAGDEPMPLLLVHDGPEYDALASLTHYVSAGIAAGRLPRLRVALLHPGERNGSYSVNDDYADALAALARETPATVRIGMGTSLGALAMLHAHRRHPDLADALFLQSGSFFTDAFDRHERRFPGYARITAFVEEVGRGDPVRPVPVALTCGGAEENLRNNRSMAEILDAQGYKVTFRETRDVHNYTAWRDAFHPSLTRLLQEVCA